MPELTASAHRRIDLNSKVIGAVLAEQKLVPKRDHDGSDSDRWEFWETDAGHDRVLFICLMSSGEHNTLELTIRIQDASAEPIPGYASMVINNPTLTMTALAVDTFLNTFEGRW